MSADFAALAGRLAGMAGIAPGWTPDIFWAATPAELAAVIAALAGETPPPPDAATIARLMEAFPDG
ncbi:phage tail assembly chaperone [Sphingomonas sp.]